MKNRLSSTGLQRGASLLEVLVAVLVLSLGILGMTGLQVRSLKGNHSSTQRTQAVMMSYYIIDAMRVDIASAKASAYNTDVGDVDSDAELGALCSVGAVSAAGLAGNNLKDWVGTLKTNLGDDDATCGAVYCNASGECRVQVRWDDTRANGLGKQTVQTVTKL